MISNNYVKTNKKLEQKEKFIETTITKITQAMENGMLSLIKTKIRLSNVSQVFPMLTQQIKRTTMSW